ncbi:MAG: hypothetical protein ACRDTD_15150, partial [Pseudonocardiaceae bacterium]
MSAVVQEGRGLKDPALVLAPLTKRALTRMSWSKSRSLPPGRRSKTASARSMRPSGTTSTFGDVGDNGTMVASGIPTFITARSTSVRDVRIDPGWQRHIDGDVHGLVERLSAETDAKAACPVRT